jgi:hypothetical protein
VIIKHNGTKTIHKTREVNFFIMNNVKKVSTY